MIGELIASHQPEAFAVAWDFALEGGFACPRADLIVWDGFNAFYYCSRARGTGEIWCSRSFIGYALKSVTAGRWSTVQGKIWARRDMYLIR